MPLSNHGFPIPDEVSPIGSCEDVSHIDSIAAKVNAQRITDIPSGIGFCLYITRACLDRVGLLTEDFGLGYYEDADFCMRAREHGFRNVCAPSVYIGHAGAKSFGQQKRSLVMRNRTIIDRRYPKRSAEWAAFTAADPLRAARETIELEAAAIPSHPRLLVTGAGVISTVASERARNIASKTQTAMILEVRRQADGAKVKIVSPAGGMPQSVQFDLFDPHKRGQLVDFLKAMEPSGIEILDPANLPAEFIDLLLGLELSYDVFVADAGLLGRNSKQVVAARPIELQATSELDRWQSIAECAERILVPCARAAAFAASSLPQSAIKKIEPLFRNATCPPRRRKTVRHLGFVPVRSCAHEQSLTIEIVRRLNGARPDFSITVIGTTIDDIGLMRGSNAFVTGAVEAAEFPRLVDTLAVGQLFLTATRPIFGHSISEAAFSCGLPIAYFDWSNGRFKSKKRDLSLDPKLSLDDVFALVNQWLPTL
jgi:hypothetical protein